MLKKIMQRLPKSSPKRLIAAGAFCLLLVGTLMAVQVARAEGRILPNVSIGGIDVGSLTPPAARERLENAVRAMNVAGLQFRHQQAPLLTVRAAEAGEEARATDAAYDIGGMIDEAFAFGHGGGTAALAVAHARAFFSEVRLPVRLAMPREAWQRALENETAGLVAASKDASFKIGKQDSLITNASGTPITKTSWNIEVVPETTGMSFDYAGALNQAQDMLSRWQGGIIDMRSETRKPSITSSEARALIGSAGKVLERGPTSLAFDDMEWKLSPEDAAQALMIGKQKDGSVFLTVHHEALASLMEEAAAAIESEAKPTSFTVGEDGRAHDFVGGTVGRKIDREASLERFDAQFASSANGVIPLAVTVTPSTESNPVAEELGVRELLGYGTSKFAGSPKNRRINIANGAKRLNGLIVKPGEEIGLLEFLKPFDASGGYVPELVIKGSRTVPEYGGGLCQIGTTTFRATMGAGLPITQRQNHSYRVSYYEPAGTDATLYDPAPDFKFVNDTQHHIVLITHIEGDQARFEFWGTRDGRVQEQSAIRMTNVTAPPEAKLIETSELPDGQKKCFETPHAGATTQFTYAITYPDGTVKSQDFRSVYKPWQQQCLIGKVGAPRIVLGKDGSINELPPVTPATSTPETAGSV